MSDVANKVADVDPKSDLSIKFVKNQRQPLLNDDISVS